MHWLLMVFLAAGAAGNTEDAKVEIKAFDNFTECAMTAGDYNASVTSDKFYFFCRMATDEPRP